MMDYKGNLTTSKKSVIMFEFAKGKSALEIAKIIGRYHQTEKICCSSYKCSSSSLGCAASTDFSLSCYSFLSSITPSRSSTNIHKRTNKGHLRVLSLHSLSWIKHEGMNNLGLTSEELFRRIGETTVFRTTQCYPLKKDISKTRDNTSIDTNTCPKACPMGRR